MVKNNPTFEEFKSLVIANISKMPNYWRYGQKVFNYIDDEYKVARHLQFDHGIDCFYKDSMVDEFLKAAYDHLYI